MTGWRALSSLALIIVLAAPAAGRDEDFLRPCRRADLIGFWQVIRFGFAIGTAVDRADPAYHLHQRYVFNADATTMYAASSVPLTPEEDQALRLAPATSTWALDGNGRLLRPAEGAPRVSDCLVVVRALRDPRSAVPGLPGDVLLTDQDETGRPLTRRLLRRVPAGE